MKCPYKQNKAIQTTSSEYDLTNEDTGICKGVAQVLVEKYIYCECIKEECAVWYDGKCHYNG